MVLTQRYCELKIVQTNPAQWPVIREGILAVEKGTFEESFRYTEEDFESFKKDNTLNYVVFDGEKIIGYLMGCPIENDENYSDDTHFGNKDTIHLESTGILPEYHGKGLGQKLLLQFLEDAKIRGYTRAVMDATSEQMIGLALKHGFVKLQFYATWQGERSSWYMEKQL
jgi:GNAT superfamily N-acetyltransferase